MDERILRNADALGVKLALSISPGFLYDVFKRDKYGEWIRIACIGRPHRYYYQDFVNMERAGICPYGHAEKMRSVYLAQNKELLSLYDYYTRHILW